MKMGQQTLEILRQGVWASLTGGFFYDPHQNVFCNAVHLYLWLFLLCAPFVTYLYFPKTLTNWGIYCIVTACTMTVLKVINMALHVLYDKAQTLSDPNLKKPLKGQKENEGEECGIEMQVLGTDNMPSRISGEHPSDENSRANSLVSIECQEHVTSTIDLKVDVHRKNSSESSDSVSIYPASILQQNTQVTNYRPEINQASGHNCRTLKVKSQSEEKAQTNPSISEELICNDHEQDPDSSYKRGDGTSMAAKQDDKWRKNKNRLQRQSSLDASQVEMVLSNRDRNISQTIADIGTDKSDLNSHNMIAYGTTKLQRYRSSDRADERYLQNRSNCFIHHHRQQSSGDAHDLQSVASDLYLENNYTKSDIAIENIENEGSKIYLLRQAKPMRKDSSSTMSALQLPVGNQSACNPRKRRHSNTGSKPIHNQMTSVRRIKSAALEISCPQPSVSNLSPHPNSAEAIAGQQIRNPQSAVLPPPSKNLVRNPHLNLCPKIGSISGNSNAAITELVYPIAEQADEKSIPEGYMYSRSIDSEDEEEDNTNKKDVSLQKRCSTTESESDFERPRTQSTDSETDNNGSRSPLLYKNLRIEKSKTTLDDSKYKASGSLPIVAIGANNCSSFQSKSCDSGCPSSDCEHASASSKDMLLVKEKTDNNKNQDGLWVDYNAELKIITIGIAEKKDSIENNDYLNQEKTVKDAKSSGAIPKTTSLTSSAAALKEDAFEENIIQKRNLGAIPKSTSRASSSASSRSFSAESFDYARPSSNDVYRNQKDQWVVMSAIEQNPYASQSGENIFHHNSRRTFLDAHFRRQPKLRRADCIRRTHASENKTAKVEADVPSGIEFINDELQNSGTTTLSIQGLMNEQYSFEKAISSTEQRPPPGTIVNIGRVDFSDSVYWRPYSLSAEKPTQPKRLYKYPLQFFGRREFKIAMDRLQLLAIFDRDLSWFHVMFAIILSAAVCLFGSTILQLGIYKDVFAFVFCLVIAGSQYSLLKSVQPDAASPIHGFNKTVAYSRPIYFCICSGILLFSHHLLKEFESNESWKINQKDFRIFGLPFSPENLFSLITRIMSIIILLFPVFFSLGLFPQINTFSMYIMEQIDMHVFGGSAACSLMASILSVIKSIFATSLLYGPAFGGLSEQKGSQHILFSIFCALLVPVSYHLSRSASDFTHLWSLIKSNLVTCPEDEDPDLKHKYEETDESKEIENKKATELPEEDVTNPTNLQGCDSSNNQVKLKSQSESTVTEMETSPSVIEPPDPLPKKLQGTVNARLKNDLVVASVLAVFVLGLHCSTVFSVLQPDLNVWLYSIAGILGFLLHYVIPQMRKHLPWLCFAKPILKQQEFGKFEVADAAKVMWFESAYVCLSFLERNVLYPLIFISALTADSPTIVNKYGISIATAIICTVGLKCVRSSYSDSANQYLILIFTVLLFRIDFHFASETFLLDYFLVSILYKKACDFLLKLQFIVTYIAPWQITWGSAFHAFAQPFSVPHSAMLFLQAALSAILSTPLNPFLGSAIFLTSYVRPIKFWERDYNTRRIDHSNTRLSSQLERDLGADDNNLNSIFYEHLTRSLQHSLCGDILLGRWGNVNQGDCFVLASDYLNCLVHIIELGNGLCTFQMRGLEFRGTYCQQREVEAISEGVEDNEGCCCCAPGHIPQMLSANAMFSTRWLAWQVIAAQYVLEGYSISENLATATLQVFEFRKVLITYYIKSIIYFVIRNTKLNDWLAPGPIQDALAPTLNRQFVDLDPIFNYNLDEDFDFRALGITRTSFCSVYMGWIQFCHSKQTDHTSDENTPTNDKPPQKQKTEERVPSPNISAENSNASNVSDTAKATESDQQKKRETSLKSDESNSSNNNNNNNNNVTKDSPLISLCLALGLLARRSLATASHSSLSGVEFFLHGLHALFKGDFRITSPRDEWVFGDMELLHGVVAPAVKMALKLHQDHFSSPDEYLDLAVLYDAITNHTKDLVISHEADPVWRSAVLRGAPNLLALRHVMEDGSDEYRIIRLTKRFLSFRVIKLNRECVRGLWAGQQQELIYLRNRNPERGSIQNAKQALRNIINSSCDQPIGYPIYVSPLITSYAETNEQLCRIIGGSFSLEKIRDLILECWRRIRQRCREGCSSGSGGIDCDTTNDVPGVYFSPAAAGTNNLSGTAGTLAYGSQSLSGAGTRGSLACINKPTSSTLIAGLLNRERDQERDSLRERANKKNSQQSRTDRERRATLPITAENSNNCSRDLTLKDAMGSTNSGLRQLTNADLSHSNGSRASYSSKISNSSSNLETSCGKFMISGSMKLSMERRNSKDREECGGAGDSSKVDFDHSLIEINKKVIIVDGMEIYDCLDLGRRIDVVWPNEQMRSCGGRSSWKDWQPQEGMVGFVVHYWQPNHPDQRFRSSVNRILYLVEIGDHFVPVGESGIMEYNQIKDTNNRVAVTTSTTTIPTSATTTTITTTTSESSLPGGGGGGAQTITSKEYSNQYNIPSTSTNPIINQEDFFPSILESKTKLKRCSSCSMCDNDTQTEFKDNDERTTTNVYGDSFETVSEKCKNDETFSSDEISTGNDVTDNDRT